MKKILIVMMLLSTPAFAQTTQLPGNTTANTNPANRIVIRNNDESLAYRTLVKPHLREPFYQEQHYRYRNNPPPVLPGAAPYNAVNQACAGTRNTSQQNKCIRDVIKSQEEIRKKYND